MASQDPENMSTAKLLGGEALNALSMVSRGARLFLKIIVGILAASVILVGIGILAKNNGLVAFGNICKMVVFFVVMVGFAALTIPFSGGKYIRATLVCAASQLVITAIMLWSPMPMTFTTYFLLNIGTAVICLAIWGQNPPMQIVGGIITLAAIGTLLFPAQADAIKRGIRGANVSKPAKFKHGEIPEIDFFDQYGIPLYKYSFDKTGKHVLFESGNYDSSLGEKLEPVTRALAGRLQKDESLISPRNFIGETTSAATPSTGSYATAPPPAAVPEPPPAPAPHIPSSPPVPEPAPPVVETPATVPAPSYKQEVPEKTREEAPVPRYKYATLFVGDAGPEAGYSQQMASWFDDGTSAVEIFQTHALSPGGKLTDTGRRQLKSLAENIVIIRCSTRPGHSGSRDRFYTCMLEAKVINTQTGEIVKTFKNSQPAYGFTDQSARKSAITLALAVAKNNLP